MTTTPAGLGESGQTSLRTERAAAVEEAAGAVGVAEDEVAVGESTGVPGRMAVGGPARPDIAAGVAATGGALAPSKCHGNVVGCDSANSTVAQREIASILFLYICTVPLCYAY